MEYRIERDSMGEVRVPADRYWGAQTQRSHENFAIGVGIETMPMEIIRAFAVLKKAAAIANRELLPERMSAEKCALIGRVCDEILAGELDGHFPLVVWQTGSGTQSNMNVNEVIANRGNELAGKKLLHPNDDVNMSQSSNDTFPTAMHIAACLAVEDRLLPAVSALEQTLLRLEAENADVLKSGRTHLQDATPLTLGQEISGWVRMLERCQTMIMTSVEFMKELGLGGTAVGTGLNATKGFGEKVAAAISKETGIDFYSEPNKFYALTGRDDFVFCHGALEALATDAMKMVDDLRLLAAGPRAGLGELSIPANEPGSSIMPGKVNPTQCEAVTMVACRVHGNQACISLASSQGRFELNVYAPIIAHSFIQSVRLLGDVLHSFDIHCAVGIEPNLERINELVNKSLMLVTALSPHIGYEKSATIAKTAFKDKSSLKEAALKLGYVTEEEFDAWVVPKDMTNVDR